MKVSKKNREIIFNKYDGRCAYCGEKLKKGWHVDEFLPVRRGFEYRRDESGDYITNKKGEPKKFVTMDHPERFHIDNQMPSCPSCNINKHSLSIEEFRSLIEGFIKHLTVLNTQYKLAERYGLVKVIGSKVTFYFEIIDQLEDPEYKEEIIKRFNILGLNYNK